MAKQLEVYESMQHPPHFRWEPWEEMSPLKVGRLSVHLLNLGKQLILAGGFITYTEWGDVSTFSWNNETLEFQDDQEIEPLPFVMTHADSVTIPMSIPGQLKSKN